MFKSLARWILRTELSSLDENIDQLQLENTNLAHEIDGLDDTIQTQKQLLHTLEKEEEMRSNTPTFKIERVSDLNLTKEECDLYDALGKDAAYASIAYKIEAQAILQLNKEVIPLTVERMYEFNGFIQGLTNIIRSAQNERQKKEFSDPLTGEITTSTKK